MGIEDSIKARNYALEHREPGQPSANFFHPGARTPSNNFATTTSSLFGGGEQTTSWLFGAQDPPKYDPDSSAAGIARCARKMLQGEESAREDGYPGDPQIGYDDAVRRCKAQASREREEDGTAGQSDEDTKCARGMMQDYSGMGYADAMARCKQQDRNNAAEEQESGDWGAPYVAETRFVERSSLAHAKMRFNAGNDLYF